MANKELIIHADIDLEPKVIGLLICSAQELAAKLLRNIKPLNLSLLQVQILHVLSMAPDGRLTVNEIRAFMIDDSPNVSRSLNKLMKNGFIEKTRSLEDQRVVHITITDAGRDMHEKADRELLKVSIELTDEEKEQLFELLAKI